jgi:hypothetical protein
MELLLNESPALISWIYGILILLTNLFERKERQASVLSRD